MIRSPEISIIVPIYNAEKYLPQCIDSILAQTFVNFELLLIDDGASDASGRICEEYAQNDPRIRVFHQENAGVSVARNKGIDEAIGKYLTFVDADDWVKPDYLQALYDALPEHNQCDGLVVESFERIYPDRSVPVEIPNISLYRDDFSRLITEFIAKQMMYAFSKLFSREIIISNRIRFMSEVVCLEDMFFILDYCCYSNYFLTINVSNYCYRASYSSDTLSNRVNSYENEMLICHEYFLRIKLYQENYAIPILEMVNVWKTTTMLFHKIILSVYSSANRYSYHQRITYMNKLLANDRNKMKKFFLPAYLADKIGKYLLLYLGSPFFDVWMRFLRAIKFKKVYGPKDN